MSKLRHYKYILGRLSLITLMNHKGVSVTAIAAKKFLIVIV